MKSFTFVSGKGGTGKTLLAVNFAISLAEEDKTVLLFDADFGLSNADILFGCEVKVSLDHIIRDKRPLIEALMPTGFGVDLISGGSGMENLIDMDQESCQNLLQELADLFSKYDFIVIDGVSGIGAKVQKLVAMTDVAILVCTPEPTSLMDGYALAKSIWASAPAHPIGLVINGVESTKHGYATWLKVSTIVGQFLSKEFLNFGSVRQDKACAASVLSRQPLLIASPNSRASKDINQMVEYVLGREAVAVEVDTVSMLDKLKSAFTEKPEAKDEVEDAPSDELDSVA